MINRIIIRIKVLQIVYARYQNDSRNFDKAENELLFSLQKSYDLYHYLLLLIPLLTNAEQRRLDIQKSKFLATESELHPNTRFADNRFAEQLRTNEQLQKFSNEKGTMWNDDGLNFVRRILNRILRSDLYEKYLLSEDTYQSDKDFILKVFKNIIWESDELSDFLEEKNIYWNDDLSVIGTFVIKTMKQFTDKPGKSNLLLPMFREDEDKTFAINLLRYSLLQEEENNQLITKQISNWEIDRVALIDLYIMQIALAEIRNFSEIPVSVSLNEYIDLAHYYSTPKSSTFINGILHAIIKNLKRDGLLFKV